MTFKELFEMSLLQTDCRSPFTTRQRPALFGEICFEPICFCCSERFRELVSISSECAVYKQTWAESQEGVLAKVQNLSAWKDCSVTLTDQLQRRKCVLAISLQTEHGDTAGEM